MKGLKRYIVGLAMYFALTLLYMYMEYLSTGKFRLTLEDQIFTTFIALLAAISIGD